MLHDNREWNIEQETEIRPNEKMVKVKVKKSSTVEERRNNENISFRWYG
jgi:hypothetical protein